MDINLYGPGELQHLTDDQVIKEFYNRLYDNPAFARRVQKILLPWNLSTKPPTRSKIVEVPVDWTGGIDRMDQDVCYEHMGYELLNPVRKRVGN